MDVELLVLLSVKLFVPVNHRPAL